MRKGSGTRETRARIIFVSPYSHKQAHSGARRRVEALVNALEEWADYELVLMAPWGCSASRVEWVPFDMEGGLLRRLWSYANLNWHLHKSKTDKQLVISESPLAPLSFGRFRVFHVIHDAKFVTEFGRSGALLVRALHRLSAIFAFRVLTVSQSEANRIGSALRVPRAKIFVSPNGISDHWLISKKQTKNETAPKIDILYVSNFAKHKGHLDLLRGLKSGAYSVVFVGSDFGCLDEVREFVSFHRMNVTILESLADDELIDLYDRARVFVFPSWLEGFGIPYLEARARGLPVVANDLPVFRELKSKLGGEVVDIRDDVALRDALLKAFSEEKSVPHTELRQFAWTVIAQSILREGLGDQ